MNFNGCLVRTVPTPGCSFVAGRSIDTPKRKLAVGETFKASDIGMHEGHVFEWWRAGWLVVAGTPEAAQIAPLTTATPDKPKRR